MTEIQAIKTSFEYAYKYILKWTNKTIIWLYIAIIPILFKIVKNVKYEFKMPIIVTILSICIFAAQFTPPIYAMSGTIPKRLLNIIYYSMYWLITINIMYWLGYMKNKVKITEGKKENLLMYIVIIIVGIMAFSTEYKETNSYIALKLIKTGEAQQYDFEIKERVKLYEDENIKDVEVEILTVRPKLLFSSDMQFVDDWRGELIANFYEKNSVKLKRPNK